MAVFVCRGTMGQLSRHCSKWQTTACFEKQYISFDNSWQITTDLNDSNLYNVKELIIFFKNTQYGMTQQYYNFSCDLQGNTGTTLGSSFINETFRLPDTANPPSSWHYNWYYTGSGIYIENYDVDCSCVLLYKT